METNRKRTVRSITILIVVTAFCYALVNGIPNVLINHIIDDYGIDGTRQGLINSTISFGVMAAVVVAPAFQGRIKKFTVYFLSAVIITAALIVQGVSKSVGLFFTASVVLGLGFGWLDGYINSIIIDVHPEDSAVPMGLLHGFFGVGSLLFPLAATALLGIMFWRGLYWVCALIMAAVAAAVFFVGKRTEKAETAAALKEDKLHFSDVLDFVGSKRNVILLVLGFSAGCIQTGISCWLVRFMTLEYGAEALGATALSCMWISSTVNRFLSPRIHAKPITLIIAGCLGTAAALTLGLAVNKPVFMVVMIAVVGLFCGHLIPMLFLEASFRQAGKTTMTTFIMQIALAIGRITIPLLMAFVTDISDIRTSMFLPVAAAVLSAVFGILASRERKHYAQ